MGERRGAGVNTAEKFTSIAFCGHLSGMTKRQQRTAKKLVLPLVAMAMLTTMMAVASVSHARPHSIYPTAAAHPAHALQRTASLATPAINY